MSRRKKQKKVRSLAPKPKAAKESEKKAVRDAAFWVFVFFGSMVVLSLGLGGWLMNHKHASYEETVVDLANQKCPVCGNPAAPDAFTDWHHLRLHDHPGDCEKALLAKPEEVLDKSGLDWREAARLVRIVNHGHGAERDHSLEKLKAKWQVVDAH